MPCTTLVSMSLDSVISVSTVVLVQVDTLQKPCTVQPKNNARARTSFCVRKTQTSCGYLRDAFARILQAARTSLRLKFKTARTSLRLDI